MAKTKKSTISPELKTAFAALVKALKKNGFTEGKNTMDTDKQFHFAEDVTVTICFHK